MLKLLLGTQEAIQKGLFQIGLKTGRSPFSLRRRPFMSNLRLLMESQWFSPQEVERFQAQKVRNLLSHAYANVPYYKRIFDRVGFQPEDFRAPQDLQGLPVLTKTDIQENKSELLARTATSDTYYSNSTGGSTGHPITFYQSYEYEAWGIADIWRGFTMCGYQLGGRRAFLWGSGCDSQAHRGFKNRWVNDLARHNMVWVNTFELTEPILEHIAKTLAWFRPRLLVAYVSAATLLARFLKERGIKEIRPEAIQTSAELLTEPQRRLLEEVFGCPVFDRYGCREVSIIAHECEAHEGLHLLAENNYTEFLIDGRPAEVGETGLVTVTNLNNWAMPFIRYQPGDLGRPAVGQCSCGRGLPRMEVVDGRCSDFIATPSGKLLYGGFFTRLFYKLQGVRQFQVIQKTADKLEIKIVPMTGFEKKTALAYLEDNIKLHGDPTLNVSFFLQDRILPSSSGKFRYVFSEISPKEVKGGGKEVHGP